MPTPFHDPRDYVAIPRVSGLRVAPDGERVVVSVQTLSADRARWVSALWALDPRGAREPRRLTRSVEGETAAEFRPDGSLLFVSKRPPPEPGAGDGEPVAGLWLLPADGGEVYCVAAPPGGVDGVAVARTAGTVVFASETMPGGEERRTARKSAGVSAILHESHPIRAWDRDLGPDERRLFALDAFGDSEEADAEPRDLTPASVRRSRSDRPPEIPADAEPRDLTPASGRALDDQAFAVTPDGVTVLTGWRIAEPRGGQRHELVAIDTATGERRTLAAEHGQDFSTPVISPDGRHAVCRRERHSRPEEPFDATLWLVHLDGGAGRDLLPGFDLLPEDAVWAPDGRAVFFAADRRGRRPVFRVDVATGEVVRLTRDDASYADLAMAPDALYALRSGVGEPPTPVWIAPASGAVAPLPAPGVPVELPGHYTEVTATAEDGAEIRGWLIVPGAGTPAPLVLWPHGGPYTSWNFWNWRWSQWVLAAHGYAVLMPDPALSTGYGVDFIRRGWRSWGPRTYADLMAITDAAAEHPDVDGTRTAVMGGSFGGYMANWIAGHTDRFDAIVTHASLWDLRSMYATTDEAHWALREFGDPDLQPQVREHNDPSRHISRIRTPMLVIHGDKDYRVPIGNALHLWWDLIRHEVPAKFLYFPDENHWVLRPGNAVIWYETVLAFLAHHVRGDEWKRPELL